PRTHDLSPISLHDALPILTLRKRMSLAGRPSAGRAPFERAPTGAIAPPRRRTAFTGAAAPSSAQFRPPNAIIDVPTAHCEYTTRDRKSTRLNSSHGSISYA